MMETDMKLEYWVAFWVAFALLAVRPSGAGFSTLFSILIHMRTADNHMSTHLWVALWFSLAGPGSVLEKDIGLPAHGALTTISTIARFLLPSDYTMTPLPFWILLFILLVLFCRAPTVGAVVYWSLLIFNTHLRFDGIHLPGLLISWYFIQALVAIAVFGVNYALYPKYIPAVLLWFCCVGVLHTQVWPFNKDFGLLWLGAWFLSFHAILFAFAPDMPPLWYAMWACIVVGMGLGFRPDESLAGFLLWALTIIALRMVLFYLYVAYFLNTTRDDMFPFNLFSRAWGLSGRRWYPLSARKHDSLNSESLCGRCDGVTSGSKIILGLSFFVKRMVEWHDFYTRKEFISRLGEENNVGKRTTARGSAFSGAVLSSLLPLVVLREPAATTSNRRERPRRVRWGRW